MMTHYERLLCHAAQDIGALLKSICPPGWGFCVNFFEFDTGRVVFISDVDRAGVAKALREQADLIERGAETIDLDG